MTGIIFDSDLVATSAVAGMFLALLAAAEAWSRIGKANPEWTRKLVHFGGGVLCLFLPWLVESPWYVLGLAAASSAVIAAGRHGNLLRSLHKVDRVTLGSEYYPLAIFLVFLITDGQPWLYVSSVLVLAVADAFAALIGCRYGSVTYNVEESDKSVQGSLAFLVIAFIAMLVPMRLLTELPTPVCILSALLVAVLVTGFEAVSLRGTDNLFIPIGVAVILSKITSKPIEEIIYQNISLVAICGVLSLIIRRSRSFNVGGAITFALFVYGAWSLGSELWALPVMAGFLVYSAMWFVFPLPAGSSSGVKVRIVFRALVIPLLLLVVGNMFGNEGFMYGPFLAACAAVLSFGICNHVIWAGSMPDGFGRTLLTAGTCLFSAALTAASPMLVFGTGALPSFLFFMASVFMTVMTGERATRKCSTADVWCVPHIAITIAAAAVIVIAQAAGWVPPWYP